jgi:hypothetical protein
VKQKRFSDEQVIRVLKEHKAPAPRWTTSAAGTPQNGNVCTWRKKYAGMEASDATTT